MRKSNKLWIISAAAIIAALIICPAAFAKVVIKCATSTQPSHIYNEGIRHMAKIVKEKSNGEMEIQLFPAAQLGSERDAVEGLQLGTLEMTLTSTGPLGNFVPAIKVFNLPFLFTSREAAYKVLDGKIGDQITASFPKIGIRALAWVENGFRNITNSKRAINKPADMDGLKIRVMEDDLFIATMKALGASPLPMAFGELYTALEQKTVDAQENPLAVIESSRFFEVQKYLAMTGHFYSPSMILVSEKFFKGLKPEQQKILQDAAFDARDFERKLSMEADQKLEAELAKQGMTVTHPDKAPFVKAVAGVYTNPKIVKAIGGGDTKKGEALIKAVQEAAK
ncbi:TRAP transporter substrate-binding protein [Dethiosulfatarculus sandiegensis]|uniref:C4-dicarboxylate ABC transporter substrate-binding protein n=1 Tax=Dethiosulfatarculus sandiegensis TaxID=1429043 RepID=A0A0D2HZG0_9BACT|nr:TRAP transporter substrate-binding protein [Dethiosulfatarculus sandiegensis]KIX15653.1 C4-dicarboxylate ABC transporter substrate-binding protein [Dethiosulfatarculus sandiegensis]